MSGDDPESQAAAAVNAKDDSAKLDQILAQLSTLNRRFDSHDLHISHHDFHILRIEKFQTEDQSSELMA